jgi:hypothetical protein
MPGKLFATDHHSVYRYDKVIRHFFKLDMKAYRIIKRDIEKNRNVFSRYLEKNYIKHEKHKRNLIKVSSVIVIAFIVSIAMILSSIELFFHYTSLEKKMELTGIAFIASTAMGVFSLPAFYSAEKELDNIDILVENANYSIDANKDSTLKKLRKESTEIDQYLRKMRKITIFHYYGVMLYAHRNNIRSEWHW